MDNQNFDNYLQNVRANAAANVQTPQQPAPQAPTQQPQQGNGGNWLTHLLPTAGSLGGGVGGAAIGTALLPGIGTIAGGILGAAFGGGGAKAVENSAEGKDIGNGVESSAVEGGIGQAVGGVAGKVLGKGAELLAGRAGNITKAATETADNAAMDKAALDTANAIKNNYGGIKPGVQSSNNLGGNQNLLQSFGLDHTDPQVMANASKGGLFLNDIDEAALKGGSPIKTTDLISSKDITTASPEEQTALVNAGIITPEGALPASVSPIQANKFAQDLNGQMRTVQGLSDNAFKNGDFTNYNAANQQLADLTGRYKNVQQLAATPEVNASIAARTISPEEKAQLVEQYGQKQADHLENAVNEAKTHQDLVSAKLPFAQMNTLSKQALGDLNAPATARGVARAKMDVNGDGIADVNPQSSGAEVAGSILHGPGGPVGVAGRALAHGANNPAILNTLSRMGELTSKIAPSAATIAATAPNMGADPLGAPQQDGTMGAAMPPTQQSPLDQLYQTLLSNYQVGGGITPNDASTAGTLATLAPQVQKNNLVAGELSALPQSFANAGGAQGAGGIMSHIAGLIPGTAAHTYQQAQQGAAQALAAQLGISPQAAMGLLPQLMQNQQTAGQSQGVLGQLTGQLAY